MPTPPIVPLARLADSARLSPAARAAVLAEVVATRIEVALVQRRERDLRTILGGVRDESLRSAPPLAPPARDRVVERLAFAVAQVVSRLPGDGMCLSQSLVLSRLLARRGIVSVLVVGVRGTATDFAAHAWVEVDERPVLETGTHTRLASY